MDVAIVLYDGFDEMDAIGPYEVFQTAGEFGGEMGATLVTIDEPTTVTASHGLCVEPDAALEDVEPDLVLVPGGGWNDPDSPGARREFDDGTIPDVLRTLAPETQLASVCTGAMLLAAAGVLTNRPATTHHSAMDDLSVFADVRDERIVDDGDVLTCGGVTAGLDLALYLVRRECGDEVGDAVATEMEYMPRV
ncbi:DJ-1/PfpI family protein [Haloarchaeobius iranensis]|uniref:DJ-1/PfpI family protein n=1 Tax=Haloarchaeobius iranensis TaxID=996166 RepID=A0A1H0AIZ7_9EURY|nr:DJ-1/PfpI family protein [Haloarchaeobius iranensis]SDN33417.1 DJ-1/PfpI family protein [Haloarchaeobius iranensis]